MIPRHWRSIRLDRVGSWGSGGTPRRGVDGYYGGTIPWLKIGDLTDGPIGDSEEKITERAIAESSAKRIPAGAVLVAMYGSIGKLGIASVPLTTNQAIAFCVPERDFDNRYIFYWLLSQRSALFRLGKGGTQLNISQTVLRALSMPVAPTSEQHQIVDAIETHFSRLDAAVASLTRAKANLKRARASVLKAAVEGRLVPTEAALARAEGREYEPASALLARILAERKAAWAASGARGKYAEPVKPETEGLPGLPEGWCWASVDELTAQVTDGDHQPPPVTEHGIPFLVIGNVKSGVPDFGSCRTVSAAYYESLDWKRRPDRDDLLYTVVGSLGIPVRVPDNRPFCVQRHIAILKRPLLGVYDYLLRAMGSGFVFRQAEEKATGTAQQTLGLASLRSMVLPLPPVAEQRRIVAEVDRRLSVLDTLEASVDANLARCARLRQAVLKHAFEGRLVAAEATTLAPLLAAEPPSPWSAGGAP